MRIAPTSAATGIAIHQLSRNEMRGGSVVAVEGSVTACTGLGVPTGFRVAPFDSVRSRFPCGVGRREGRILQEPGRRRVWDIPPGLARLPKPGTGGGRSALMVWEVFQVLRAQDLMRTRSPRPAEPPQAARSGLEGSGDSATPPRQVRQRNRCSICQVQIPDPRTLCSYCRQYVS